MKSFRRILLLTTLLFSAASFGRALAQNPGDPTVIFGKVIAFSSESITLETGDPNTGTQQETFTLPPAYLVLDAAGNNVALEVGLMVKVEGVIGDDNNPRYEKVIIDANQPGDPPPDDNTPTGDFFVGIVRSNNGTTLQLEGWDDATQTPFYFNATLASGGHVFDQAGNEISLSQIPVGNVASGDGEKQSNGDFIANNIKDDGPADTGGGNGGGEHYFGGMISAVTSTTFDVSWENQDEGTSGVDTYSYDSSTEIIDESGIPTTLVVGDYIEGVAIVLSDQTLYATHVTKSSHGGQPGGGPQPGDKFQAGGEITQVGADFIVTSWFDEATGESGTNTLYLSSGLAIVDEDGNPATFQVGDHVGGEVEVQSDNSWLLLSVIVYSDDGGWKPGDVFEFGGKVTFLGNGFMILEWGDPATGESDLDTVYYDPASVADDAGNPVTLVVGNYVSGMAEVQSDETIRFQNVTLKAGAPDEPFTVYGEVVSFGADFIELTWDDNGQSKTQTFPLSTSVPIVDVNGNPIQLEVGQIVGVEVKASSPTDITILSITVQSEGPDGNPGDKFPFGGTLINIGADYIEIEYLDQDDGFTKNAKASINAETIIIDDSGNPTELIIGAFVEGTVVLQEDNSLLVDSMVVHSGGINEPQPFGGVVTAVGVDYLDIEYTGENGSLDTIRVKIGSESTLSDQDGNPIALADFAVGDKVHGEVNVLGPDDLTAAFIAKGEGLDGSQDFVGGSVIEVGSDYLLVFFTDHESGDTGTVKVLVDNQTMIIDVDSSAIALTDISVGEQVYAQGDVTIAGELLAKVISKLQLMPTAEINFTGQIIRAYDDQLFLSGVSPTGVTYFLRLLVSSNTELTDESGNPLTLSSFQVNDQVHGEGSLTGDYAVNVTSLSKGSGDNITAGQKVPFSGIITEVGNGYFVSEYGHPARTKRNDIDSGTIIQTASGGTAILTVGDFFAAVSEIGVDGSLKVLEVSIYDGGSGIPGVNIPLEGQISEVGTDYLIVQDQVEGELKILVLPNTLDPDGNPITATDFSTGESFNARGVIQACELVVLTEAQGGSGTEPVSISGTIAEVGADYLMVSFTDSNGVDRTERVDVDQDTQITDLLGTELTIEGLFAGDFVILTGTMDKSGRIIGDFIQKDDTQTVRDTLDFHGDVVELGDGFFDIDVSGAEGDLLTFRGFYTSETPIVDRDGNPAGLEVGVELSVRGVPIDSSSFDAISIIVESQITPMPEPGDTVDVEGYITEISGNRVNLRFDSPDSPVPSAWIDIPGGTPITTSGGANIELGWLASGDELYVDGIVNQDGTSITAGRVEYLKGGLRLFSGKVVSVATSQFEMEARDATGRSIVAQVAVVSGTRIQRRDSGEILTISDIIKGTIVSAVVRFNSGTSFNAIQVTVPPRERLRVEGRVLELLTGGFALEIQENQNTFKAVVNTSGATVWLFEVNGGYETASSGDLATDNLVRVSGVRTGALSASADTVIIRDTGQLEIRSFTILDGKLSGSSLTFNIDFNEGTGSSPLEATASLTVTPDFANLSGTLDLNAFGGGTETLKLVKVSGTSGALTGRWSGYSQAGSADKVLVTAELFQSGSTVTGKITQGGQASPDGEAVPEAGDEVTFIGQVTSVEPPTLVITYLNQLNQTVDKAVIVHSGTQYVDVDGKTLRIDLDSLLSREVDVTGILQDNLSVVASKIEVYPVSGEGNVSLSLPLLRNLSWNSGTRKVQFAVDGDLLDNISSDDVSFSGQLAGDGNSITLTASFGSDLLTFSARRLSGDDENIGGEWTGSVTQVVSDRTKIWPAFLSIFEQNGSFGGNYEIGQSRFKSAVTSRNGAPVFQPVAEVMATEGQAVNVQLSASDPDGDQIALSVSGIPISGATFTDNGDGTGTYSVTVPQLSASKNELFINFQADDGKGGVSSIVVEIEVAKLNRQPELGALPDTIRLVTGQKYEVTIPVHDAEGGELEFEYSGLPTWVRTASSKLTFEPPFDYEGTFTFTVTVEDDQDGEASRTYAVKVIKDNRAPRFAQIQPITVQAGENVSFTVRASDPDVGDQLTYSAAVVGGVNTLPAGASFDPASGAFNWTPAQDQVGPFKAAFVVSDSKGAKATMTVNIFVGQVAAPPTIVVPDTVVANQGESASFTATGQSSTGGEVEFLARNLPSGSNWSTLGDSLEWYPSFQQQGEYVVTMSASDGNFRTDRDVVIIVNPSQQIPTLEQLQDYTVAENQVLRFQVNGSYPDGSRVVFDPPLNFPPGSSFDKVTGSFRFLPNYTQAGSYPLTFNVTATNGTVYSVSNTVTVTEKNRKPKIADLGNVSANTGDAISFNVTATDPDAGDVLTYAAENLPQGATFNTSVDPPVFSWTPSIDGTFEVSFTASDPGQMSDRATVVITVGEQNLPPVLGQLSDLRVAEGDTLTVVVSASDPEGDPVSVFVSPMPTGADFDNDSKTFTFRPSYAQSGRYNLRFVASDGELTDESRITITVADVALPPRITVQAAWTVTEGDELQFTVNVRDAAGNRRSVFSSNLPPGATLESETGKFLWRPFYDQAGEYQVSFNASDGNMGSQADVRIVVTDSNQPPTLFRVEHQEVLEGDLIGFEISAFDPDGDDITIGIDSSGTPYINSAEIRNNNVFVFNTALLDPTIQIPSAVFKVTASDGRGGADTMRVDFRIIRQDDVNVPDVPPGGDPFSHDFPGTGLSFRVTNNGSDPINGQITGFEVSGELNTQTGAGTQLAGDFEYDLNSRYPRLAGSKDKVTVRPFLADDGSLGGDFYSVRRGWGLDLSSDLLSGLTTLQFDLTLTYQDRDIPATDIPEFQESAISIFGLDVNGNFVQIATQLDTAANTATAPADLSIYTDFTLGVILDLAAPVISYTSKLVSTTNEAGPYNVITTIVDNVIITNARLYYSTDGQSYNSVLLTPDPSLINGYTGNIPGQLEGSTVYYYIEASDDEHTVTDPPEAPQTAYQFSILLDGVSGAGAGDANGDGSVNIFDLLEVLKILSGKSQATPEADADGNGRVDIFDLLEVLKLMK